MGNHDEKPGLYRILCGSQFTFPDMAGTSPNPLGNYTDTRSSKPNQACHTPDFAYPLISSILFPSSSSTSLSCPQLHHHYNNTKSSHPALSLHIMINSSHLVQHTLSTAYTEYSIHWVPSTASTQDCFSSLHYHRYELTPECSLTFRPASLHDRPPSASSPWWLKGEVTFLHSPGCELTNWWIESHVPSIN